MYRLQLYLFPICPSVTATPAPWWAGERSSAYLLVWIFMDLLLLDTRLPVITIVWRGGFWSPADWICWDDLCRPQSRISQYLWRNDLCILLYPDTYLHLDSLYSTIYNLNTWNIYLSVFCRKWDSAAPTWRLGPRDHCRHTQNILLSCCPRPRLSTYL